MKQVVEEHPLAVVVAACIATGSLVAGIVHYIESSTCELAVSKVAAERDKLAERFLSIDRHVGQESDYFDITRLMIARDKIRTLPQDFVAFDQGAFFVQAPKSPSWSYQESSEGALISEMMGKAISSGMVNNLTQARVHLWRADDSVRVTLHFEDNDQADISMKLFPFVGAQSLTSREIAHMTAAMLSDEDDDSSASGGTSRGMDSTLLKMLNPAPNTDVVDTTRASGNEALSERIKTYAKLEGLFRGDLAGILLATQLTAVMSFELGTHNVSVRIVSAEKRGNAIYLQTETTFEKALMQNKQLVDVFLTQEVLCVTAGDRVFTFKSSIPTLDHRASTFAWVGQWLSGIRIPLDI